MRAALQPKAIITLVCDDITREFQIEYQIGDGASCIAYEATLVNGSNAGLRYRIKECYPYNASIVRRGLSLVWENEEEREHAFTRLRFSHQLLLQLRNDEQLGDSMVVSSLYEGNNTLYMVMELNHAQTYDKVRETSIHSALESTRVLASHIGQLHDKGYLHLDIKPSNFLVKHQPSTSVWLFDVDSFTSLDDIATDKAMSYPYSEGNAAPEQLCGKTKKLCPATDIYAIGAILFSKIMGRPVCNADMGLFADWDFSGPLFENVNPKVKRILREIFHKTLSASTSRRYQTTTELVRDIGKALNVTIEGKPYLQASERRNTIRFVGREKELSDIHQAFRQGHHAVFLHGEGGIGKSSVAIAYGEKYNTAYDVVIFLRYRDSLRDLIDDISICNYDDESNTDGKRRLLRKLLDKHVLLIVDNFDVDIDQDEFLPDLLDYPAHILFTSRTNFAAAYEGNVAQIEIERLPDEHLVDLFSHASKMEASVFAGTDAFAKLCKRVEYNTYLIDLLGRQCDSSCISVDTLWSRIKHGLTNLKPLEKVWTRKDDKPAKRNISDALRVLFRVADLDEDQQRALRNLYMLRFLSVNWEAYCSFSCARNIDVVNDLVDRGWVQKHGSFFSLHPLVEELVERDLQPNEENCAVFTTLRITIDETIELYGMYGAAEDLEREHKIDMLYSFALHSDLTNPDVRKLVLYWIKQSILSEEGMPSSSYDIDGWEILSKFDSITALLSSEEIVTIRFLHLIHSMFYCKWTPDENSDERWKRVSPAVPCYCLFMRSLYDVSRDCAYQAVADVAKALHNWVLYNLQKIDFPQQIVKNLYAFSPESFDKFAGVRCEFGLPVSDEELAIWNKPSILCNPPADMEDEEDDFEEDESFYTQYVTAYHSCSNKVDFVRKVYADETIFYSDRFEIIYRCLERPFWHLYMNIRDIDYSWVNWAEQVEILDIEHANLLLEDFVDRDSYLEENLTNRILAHAALSNIPVFEKLIDELFMNDAKEAKRMLNHNTPWWTLAERKTQIFQQWPRAIYGLVSMKRASYAAPVVKRIIEGWQEYVRKLPDYTPDSERELISLFQLFIECLEAAEMESNIPEQYRLPYNDLIWEYERRIDELTDTKFIIKPPEDIY